MTTPNYTPGPWSSGPLIDNGGISLPVQCHRVYMPGNAALWITGERQRENAQLIAAAPELLEALAAMLTHMGMDEDEYNAPTFSQARAAIAKATGQ